MLSDEDTDDCQQATGDDEIAFVSLTTNHEPHASLAKDPLQAFDGEARELIAVGDHNFSDAVRVSAVQKG